MTTDPRLIEDYIPIEAISDEARREKSIRRGHIATLHLWWARRPLVAARAAVYGALAPAPASKAEAKTAADFTAELCKYPGVASTIAAARDQLWTAHAARLTVAHGHLVTAEDIAAGRAPRPRVLDMFAGGGAIPLEALRLGCDAYALDLNPVAHIIQLCTLVYPQQYGAPDPAARGCAKDGSWAGLAAEVEHWGKWVLAQAQAEIGDLYPPIPDPAAGPAPDGGQLGMDFLATGRGQAANLLTPVAYLWTRTVRCKNPACGATVPLARQTWLATKDDIVIAAKPIPVANSGAKRIEYRIVDAPTKELLEFDASAGTRKGNISCPFCGTVADSDYVKSEGLVGGIAVQPIAFVGRKPGEAGKHYLPPNLAGNVSWPDEQNLVRRINELALASGIHPPNEQIVNDAKGSAWCVMYGLDTFGRLFTPRQNLALLTFATIIRGIPQEMSRQGYSEQDSKIVTTLLGLTLSRLSNFSANLCTWFHSGGRGVKHVFARQALPMVWDFAETNPFNEEAASWATCLDAVVSMTDSLAAEARFSKASVGRGSALSLSFPSNYFDAVITDPPYYDNVPYSNLSDFFYVWLKRSIGFLYPEHFASELTPKKSEAVADASRHENDRVNAALVYERMMQAAFSEANRVLKPNAPLIAVYAHKTTQGWATLIEAMRSAGFSITEAWPLDTENESRLVAVGNAALASLIFMVARKRTGDVVGSYETDVQPQLYRIVRERVDRLWAQGVTGADLVIACLGAGMQAFTQYARVEYANGEPVPADSFLTEVEGAVLEALLAKLFGVNQAGVASVDAVTRFYILWRYSYRHATLAAGEAIVFAYPLHVELDGQGSLSQGSHALVEKKGGKYRLRDFTERGDDESLGLPRHGRPAALVDVLHRVLWLVERQPAAIPKFLDEAVADIDQLRVVAQVLAGQALAGNGSGGGRVLVAARGAEAAALRKLTGNWRALIEVHRGGMV